jgi:hypothetical protein
MDRSAVDARARFVLSVVLVAALLASTLAAVQVVARRRLRTIVLDWPSMKMPLIACPTIRFYDSHTTPR